MAVSKQYRLTFCCNGCGREHQFVGPLARVQLLVAELLDEEGTDTVLIEDEASALERDLANGDQEFEMQQARDRAFGMAARGFIFPFGWK